MAVVVVEVIVEQVQQADLAVVEHTITNQVEQVIHLPQLLLKEQMGQIVIVQMVQDQVILAVVAVELAAQHYLLIVHLFKGDLE